MSGPRKLRELLARQGIVRSIAAHDVLSAIVLERAGCELTFVGGFGVSASRFGLPDLGFLGVEEMADAVRRMAGRIAIPVVADGDTGHGDIHNVWRCVSEFEGAGAAGIILEDQAFPKRCGHFEGKRVIPAGEMVGKLRAALGARSSADFVVVARTDARETLGLDEAIDRANRYCEAGADVAFIEAPRDMAQIERVAKELPYPKLLNMFWGGKTPVVQKKKLEALGFNLVIVPGDLQRAAIFAMQQAAKAILKEGHTESMAKVMATFEDREAAVNTKHYMELDERYAV